MPPTDPTGLRPPTRRGRLRRHAISGAVTALVGAVVAAGAAGAAAPR